MELLNTVQEHKSKYIYLLAYASSVCDTWNYKRNTRDDDVEIIQLK